MLEKFKEFLSIFIGTLIVLISSFMVSYYLYNNVSILSMILVILGVLVLYPAYQYWSTEILNFLNKKK